MGSMYSQIARFKRQKAAQKQLDELRTKRFAQRQHKQSLNGEIAGESAKRPGCLKDEYEEEEDEAEEREVSHFWKALSHFYAMKNHW